MQLYFQNSWRGIAIDALQMKLVLQSFEIEFDWPDKNKAKSEFIWMPYILVSKRTQVHALYMSFYNFGAEKTKEEKQFFCY